MASILIKSICTGDNTNKNNNNKTSIYLTGARPVTVITLTTKTTDRCVQADDSNRYQKPTIQLQGKHVPVNVNTPASI